MVSRRIAALTLAVLAAGAPASLRAAQEPPPSPAPTPAAGGSDLLTGATAARPAPQASPTPAPAAACDATTICLRADKQEQLSKEQYRLTGFVDIQLGQTRINADTVDLFQTDLGDGKTSRRVVAQGNVVFMAGEERLSGSRLEMDLDTSKGVFEDAQGFVSPGVMVEADRIERVDVDTYKISGGRFTSCTQPNPRWSFSASSATLDVDKRIRARNVVFRVKEVPAFYIPYFLYPIEQDQRSTGLLFPHFGQSSTQGFSVGGGFFWAMGRSVDQTFYVDHYSKGGWGLGHELRYALPSPSRGNFRSTFRRTTAGGGLVEEESQPFGWEYDLNWSAIQALPGKVRATLNASAASNLQFQQQWQDSLDLASQRNRYFNFSLQRSFGPANVQLSADSNDVFFSTSDEFARRRRLPSFRVSQSPRKVGRTGIVFQYETRAERLSFGNQDTVNQYTRFDAFPRVSRPFSSSFLQVTPQFLVRYTRYGATQGEGTELDETPLSRQYAEASVEMRGPSFSRIFENEGGAYSDRFKHVLQPEAVWTYRSTIDEFDLVPRFDDVDPIVGTHEVRYGLVQRFSAKRPGASGKPEPYEFLNWRVSQTYYVNINDLPGEFDPNYSSAFFGVGGTPSHYSPVQSRLSLRPTPRLNTSFDVEYDVNFKEVRSMGLSTRVDYRRVGLDARWSRGRYRNREGELSGERNTVRGDLRLELLPSRFTVQGSADYNILEKEVVQSAVRARYDVQCCGFVAEMIDTHFNLRNERQFRFAIELANIGSIGNMMGQEADDRSRAFMGGR